MENYVSAKHLMFDWCNLPAELLGVILSNLDLFDYVRFGAVSRSFQSVFLNQKPQRIAACHKLPPMLSLIPLKDFHSGNRTSSYKVKKFDAEFNRLSMYKIKERKFYSHGFEFPPDFEFDRRFSPPYTSHCWWIIRKSSMFHLYNPFTRESIKVPYNIRNSDWFGKVILSIDPTTCPDDFAIATICRVREKGFALALKKTGQKSWMIVFSYGGRDIRFRDIIFHKGLLYALEGSNKIFSFDYSQDRFVPMGSTTAPHSFCLTVPHLVEVSNGDLLLVLRSEKGHHLKQFEGFKFFKLSRNKMKNPYTDGEEFNGVEIFELENNDSIFLADNGFFSLSTASCASNFNAHNCLYFIENDLNMSNKVRVFHLNDGTFSKLEGFGVEGHYPMSMFWITPILR